jgi:hypothetical protein
MMNHTDASDARRLDEADRTHDLTRVKASQGMPTISLTSLARVRGSGPHQQAWRGGAWRAPSRWRAALVWGVVQARLAQTTAELSTPEPQDADLKRDEDDPTYG